RMSSLVEDLLLLARLDSGRPLEREEVDLSLVLIEAIGDAHAAGPEHHWDLELPEEPVVVLGDTPRLHQVVVNLLANARTHTPPRCRVPTSRGSDPSASPPTPDFRRMARLAGATRRGGRQIPMGVPRRASAPAGASCRWAAYRSFTGWA